MPLSILIIGGSDAGISAALRAHELDASARATVRQLLTHTTSSADGLKLPTAQLESVTRLLRKALGCGSWIDDGRIVLQGDLATGATVWLRARGAARVTAGN